MRTPLLALTLLTASCGLFSGPAVKPVQLVNGFDFPLTITLTSEGGSETSYELAPKARVGLDVSGRYTVSAKKADGTEVVSGDHVIFLLCRPDDMPDARPERV